MAEVIIDSKHAVIQHPIGFYQLANPPTQEELDKFYAEHFFQTHKPNYAKEEEEDRAWHEMLYEDRLEDINHARCNPASLLEVGCGTGRFLNYMDAASLVESFLLGIEPNRDLADRAAIIAGLNVECRSWNDPYLLGYGPFDVIVACSVLEHLLMPVEFIEWCWKMLVPNGVLYLQVPNDFTIQQKEAAIKIDAPNYWVHYPDHINYFNFDSLEALLKECGFYPMLRDTTYPMEQYLIQGFDYIAHPKLGRDLHRERIRYELGLNAVSRPTRRMMMRKMAKAGIGRDAIVYAKKLAKFPDQCDLLLTKATKEARWAIIGTQWK